MSEERSTTKGQSPRLCLSKQLSKQLWGWWFKTPSCLLWCHCNGCVSMFPSPYLPQSLCSPVPIFPSPDISRPYSSQFLYSQSLSSPTRYVLCFPVPLLPSPYVLQPLYSPVLIFPMNGFPSLCSAKMFPSPYVPQSLCSPLPMFP